MAEWASTFCNLLEWGRKSFLPLLTLWNTCEEMLTRCRRTAICRGAVYKGFMEGAGGNVDSDQPNMISVTSTVSRLSLGLSYKAPFKEKVHDPADKEWDSHECEWKARNQMDWFLKKV